MKISSQPIQFMLIFLECCFLWFDWFEHIFIVQKYNWDWDCFLYSVRCTCLCNVDTLNISNKGFVFREITKIVKQAHQNERFRIATEKIKFRSHIKNLNSYNLLDYLQKWIKCFKNKLLLCKHFYYVHFNASA